MDPHLTQGSLGSHKYVSKMACQWVQQLAPRWMELDGVEFNAPLDTV